MTLNDDELRRHILQVDKEMDSQGIEPNRRHFLLPIEVMRRLGLARTAVTIAGSIGEDPIHARIRNLHKQLFRPKDLASGTLHNGCFIFRGTPALVTIPIIYGQVAVNPYEWCDLTDTQINWLRSIPGQDELYLANFCNLFDFAAGCVGQFHGYRSVPKESVPLLRKSAQHTQGAAAALCAGPESRLAAGSVVQDSLLAAELAMKSALAGAGYGNRDLSKLGHQYTDMALAVGENYPNFDIQRVEKAIMQFPRLVEDRYFENTKAVTLNDIGSIAMGSQAVSGAVARALCNHSLHDQLQRHVQGPI